MGGTKPPNGGVIGCAPMNIDGAKGGGTKAIRGDDCGSTFAPRSCACWSKSGNASFAYDCRSACGTAFAKKGHPAPAPDCAPFIVTLVSGEVRLLAGADACLSVTRRLFSQFFGLALIV